MADTAQSEDDNNSTKKPHKRGKVIQPLHDLNSSTSNLGYPSTSADDDELARLAARAAELAEQVHGNDSPSHKTLQIETDQESDVKYDISSNTVDLAVENTRDTSHSNDVNLAADIIRQKLSSLYGAEPDLETEVIEAENSTGKRSEHQNFIHSLTHSGKSLADIQTEWHNYYVALPNEEKHAVWQEFYKNQHSLSSDSLHAQQAHTPKSSVKKGYRARQKTFPKNYSFTEKAHIAKEHIAKTVSADGRIGIKDHAKSLLFGLGLASVVGLLIAFFFFNPVFIAPFISPSTSVSATPIIGNNVTDIGPESKIIIPKINLEVPVVFGIGTTAESAIQNALEEGVVHFAASPEPGEKGNAVIVGHSSNNILNAGKYKFAFVLLSRLENDDTFFVHKDGVRYTYKIYDSKVVPPSDVSVLGPAAKPNSITLITCDPPGTSINRLIVVAEQISPDPGGNKESSAISNASKVEDLPSNAPSLWSRIWPF